MRCRLLFLGSFLVTGCLSARQHQVVTAPSIPDGHWIDTWTAMPQLTEYTNLPPPPYNGSGVVFQNSTIRQTLHMTTGADQIRIRVSNAFGITDLPITAVTVALPSNGSSGDPAIQPETTQTVTFDGAESFTVPHGALAISDPLNFTIQTSEIISVTIYLAEGQASPGNELTSHPGSRATTWFTMGNQVNATNLSGPLLNSTQHWFFLSAIEAWSPPSYSTLAIIGDSITDGRASDTDQNDRWPDNLFYRMQTNHSTSTIAIANEAAGGNRVLADGLGPSVLSRIDRDVLAQSGVKYAMIFEGVNDIGVAANDTVTQTVIGDRLIAAYEQIISRVHARGIPMFAATITPFGQAGVVNATLQPYSDPERERTRQRLNQWVRESGRFDAVVDFDAMLADPQNPVQLNPVYNSGDFLHPNELGYMKIADDFPLGIFEEFEGGVGGFI